MDTNVGRLREPTPPGYGKNLYILGTAGDGPLMEPVKAVNIDKVDRVFGRDGTLFQAWNEANQVAGQRINIFLVRISGENAEFDIGFRENDDYESFLSLRSANAGSKHNKTEIYIHNDAFEIVNPPHIGGNHMLRYVDYPTLGTLSARINQLSREDKVSILSMTKLSNRATLDLVEHCNKEGLIGTCFNLENGYDGIDISKNEMYKNIESTLEVLEGQPIDILLIADAYFDDPYPVASYGINDGYGRAFFTEGRDYITIPHATVRNKYATFHGLIVDFCYKQLLSSIVTHGVISFNPVENVEDVVDTQPYLAKAIFATPLSDRLDLVTKQGDDVTDHGRFISITAGEFEYVDEYGNSYYNNASAGYAAMVCSEMTPRSTTNKPIPNITELRYHFDDGEAESLSKLGVTTFRYSVMKALIVVSNGVTAEREGSPYHTMSNTRMIQLTVCRLKHLLDEFIGQDVGRLKATSTINKAIDTLISELKATGVIKDIKYNLDIDNRGYARLELNIAAIYSNEYVKAVGNTKL